MTFSPDRRPRRRMTHCTHPPSASRPRRHLVVTRHHPHPPSLPSPRPGPPHSTKNQLTPLSSIPNTPPTFLDLLDVLPPPHRLQNSKKACLHTESNRRPRHRNDDRHNLGLTSVERRNVTSAALYQLSYRGVEEAVASKLYIHWILAGKALCADDVVVITPAILHVKDRVERVHGE
ncbi:uncharacterized protein K489DRAFT_117003 [Dissoconium aciculare CBS 342.82]|uniref:Uncharacterized protein n=1 Tax=Dissoconium aciculare CBS 342.82 TaxID=1314786 RepID=A0A6J3MEQ2_9PEZI|nr:uncharacterized protein K489DRAFT_117003 [Dissoconium aciculare CBS 342.82]KAF1826481.1 hypothetical protein K489DRAFT_117003 [Dissoconium aciculare CBS 342.82]